MSLGSSRRADSPTVTRLHAERTSDYHDDGVTMATDGKYHREESSHLLERHVNQVWLLIFGCRGTDEGFCILHTCVQLMSVLCRTDVYSANLSVVKVGKSGQLLC